MQDYYLQFHFGLYELDKYAAADSTLKSLKEEREEAIQDLYDDISPTMTGVNYEEGRWYSQTTNPESMAIEIISAKERYKALIEKETWRTNSFNLGMETLTERERDVIQVYYFRRTNDLGLSNDYFNQVLNEAQNKLCSFLAIGRKKYVENNKRAYRTELAQQISKRDAY